ncbi:MAG: hypothetical protein ACK5YB_02360 [Burkholderiales bacterium]
MNHETMKDNINVIPRRPAPSEPPPIGSFQQLRSEGLRLLQSLCGYQWTDYNIHDPGVTMLEAQCYALTEIVYRADMPVADHLTGEDGSIDFTGLSLHPPEDVYACRPTSTDDIRRALLDAVPAAEDIVVNVVLTEDGVPTGRYHVDVRAASFANRSTDEDNRANCLRTVAAAYRKVRNVCEDLQSVEAIVEVPCQLHANVEIATGYDPVDTLAAIYDRCYRYIAAPDQHEYHDSDGHQGYEGGAPPRLDEILDGPKLDGLHLAHPPATEVSQRDGQARVRLFIGDLGAEIAAIPGVTHVTSLWLVVNDGEPQAGSVDWRWCATDATDSTRTSSSTTHIATSPACLHTLTLTIPDAASQQNVRLIRRGETVSVSADDVRAKFIDLQIANRAHRPPSSIAYADFPRPQGRQVSAAPFVSSQLHFPAIYGLNRYGVPVSASPAEHAIMRQTKAYLALCDQVMANAATQLQHVRTLYSADWGGSHSYWWRMLDEQELPGVRDLYDGDADIIVKDVYSPFERFYDRKNRVLDYLLALYGETYTQGSLHKFSPYLDEHELQHWLLKNKTAFVQHVLPMGRDRAGGFDYGLTTWERPGKCGGLEARVGLLLGFEEIHSRSLTRVVTERRLRVDNEPRLNPADLLEHHRHLHVERMPFEWEAPDSKSTIIEFMVKAILRQFALDLLLRSGLQRSRYRLLPVSGSSAYVLLLDCHDKGHASGQTSAYASLAQCASREEAIRVAARLRDVLLGFNRKCEGLHLVEHCLLRPQQTPANRQAQTKDEDFFALRVSFVFPAWTGRTRSTAFRRFAEETVALNCPAHVRPQCLWLNFREMCDFENDYRLWLDRKVDWCQTSEENAEARDELNRLAAAVVRHLEQHTESRPTVNARRRLQ